MKYNQKNKLWGIAFAAPALIIIVVLFGYSMLRNVYISFFDWNGVAPKVFVGLENYARIFKDSNFLRSTGNTLMWVAFTIVFAVGCGLLVAVFIKDIWGENLFKSVFFIPITISFIAVGAIWSYMFSKEYGVINEVISLLGLDIRPAWLFDMPLNNISLMVAYAWQQLGYSMVMFLMGLTSVPKEQIEASMIDGCNKWQTFVHVTLPMLKPITTVVVGMAIVNSFKVFDLVYMMTRGGPVRSSETLALTMFVEAFQRSNRGYGAAIGVLLTLLILPVTAMYIKSTNNADLADNK